MSLRRPATGARRSGPYRVDRLILRYGTDAKLFEWTDEITTDCWRKQTNLKRCPCSRMPRICRWWCRRSASRGRRRDPIPDASFRSQLARSGD
jgi:hypothetical protein